MVEEEGKLMWPITVPNLVVYHPKVISGLVVFCWKIEKNDRDRRDIETVTDGTPLKMYTKW